MRIKMLHVETVDLSQCRVTLPSDRVGLVIAQPYMPDASLTSEEPYKCTELAKPEQLAMLTETLNVARAAQHGASKTHFTIIPEYSIPGPDGIARVQNILSASNWPNGTVVIGGTDALTQEQYVKLLQCEATHVDAAQNGAGRVRADQWVNCAITWVKDADGKLERWIQPKLQPAWEEVNVPYQHMFRGSSVYLFKGLLENGAPYRFGTLVCFDWIATVGALKPCQWILSDLQQQATGNQLPISWLFIIQRNPKPSHQHFLTEVVPFFDQTEYPNALRNNACLVFANTAGKATPGRTNEYGGTSLVLSYLSGFTKPSCPLTFSLGGPRFRDGSKLLAAYRDLVFRERGACIHSFIQINPASLTAPPAGRTIAVENADVFPISGKKEPRAPAAAVPASIKWLNDELDDIPSLSHFYQTVALSAQVDNAHLLTVCALRGISAQSVGHAIKLAAAHGSSIENKDKWKNADEWSATESEALRHLVHTLDIVGVGFPSPTVGADPAHATVMINNKTIDLIAISGASHQVCIEHSKTILTSPQRQVLLISRDQDNTTWSQKLGSFLQPVTPKLGQERNITDPASGSLHLGYQNLLEIFRRSATPADVVGGINADLAA
jgi:hypothetical protein